MRRRVDSHRRATRAGSCGRRSGDGAGAIFSQQVSAARAGNQRCSLLTGAEGSTRCPRIDPGPQSVRRGREDHHFSLGPPAIADVDGDGRAEIVVMTRDGMLNAIAQAK